MTAPFALLLLLASPAAGAFADVEEACARVRAEIAALAPDEEGAWTRFEAALGALPDRAAPVAARARRWVAAQGNLQGARQVLLVALKDGCGSGADAASAERARAEVAALLRDGERFFGRRAQPDAVDRLLAWLGGQLKALLETDAMQRYAATSRVAFLSLLGLFVVVVAVRVFRARVRGRAGAGALDDGLEGVRRQERSFSEWRQEADARLSAGDLRGALCAGQRALLSRLGEVEGNVVTPARTRREILARLDAGARPLVEAPLSRFERAFFGGRADAALVMGWLSEVDKAAGALEERARWSL